MLDLAKSSAGQIVGSLASAPATKFRLELFASISCDTASSNGEGETYLGFTSVTTDGAGAGAFDVLVAGPIAAGQTITATATDPTGNTSEFSKCVVAVA